MSNLAHVLCRRGKYAEAEQVSREALALMEEVLGNEHPSTLASRHDFALALFQQGKYPEAADLYSQNLGMEQEVLGYEPAYTLESMSGLADVFFLTKQVSRGGKAVPADTWDWRKGSWKGASINA
ncbi:uncharacterized protein BJX67DRAFT_366149 [Aspergillus lucknowensis]|uniref:Kinesin light chain n=1 Tax=Aspergillus lucknowensis TaxID=176173 RepID=A0ABR4LD77_9EURO